MYPIVLCRWDFGFRECLAAPDTMPARMIPMAPFGARFFKNARACPRPANPHIQGPLQILQCSPSLRRFVPVIALSIAKARTESARAYWTKSLRSTSPDYNPHFDPPQPLILFHTGRSSSYTIGLRDAPRADILKFNLPTRFQFSTSPTTATKFTSRSSAIATKHRCS